MSDLDSLIRTSPVKGDNVVCEHALKQTAYCVCQCEKRYKYVVWMCYKVHVERHPSNLK